MTRRLKSVPAPFKTWGAYFYFQLGNGLSASTLAIEHGRACTSDVVHSARRYAEKRGLTLFPAIQRTKGSRVLRASRTI